MWLGYDTLLFLHITKQMLFPICLVSPSNIDRNFKVFQCNNLSSIFESVAQVEMPENRTRSKILSHDMHKKVQL